MKTIRRAQAAEVAGARVIGPPLYTGPLRRRQVQTVTLLPASEFGKVDRDREE